MFLRFRSFSCKHGRISKELSKGTLERSLSTNLGGKKGQPVSTSLPTNFHAFYIPFRGDPLRMASSTLLIQKSSLRRNNNVLTSVIKKPFYLISGYTNNRDLSRLSTSPMTRLWKMGDPSSTHQTRKPFYITPCRQKNLASRENYVFELHQVMMFRLSRVGRTSWDHLVSHGRVRFISFQNFIFLSMKN